VDYSHDHGDRFSRVGVIEGVVNVQQGATEKKLLPGEQIATNPAMQPVPLAAQMSWSRSAASYLALLRHPSSVHETQRAAATDPAGQGQNAKTPESQNGQVPRGAFERPSDTPERRDDVPFSQAGRRGFDPRLPLLLSRA
jgi:hypothetical protein